MSKTFSPHCVFRIEIPGRVYVKKNTQRVYGIGNKKRAIPSKNYRGWEMHALALLKQARLRRDCTLLGDLHASYTFHFKNKQAEADVSNLIEGPQDCLAESLIIENDKQIMSLDARKVFDGSERVIIEVWKLTKETA